MKETVLIKHALQGIYTLHGQLQILQKYLKTFQKVFIHLVEISAPSGYEIADKMYVNISSNNGNFSIKMLTMKLKRTD